MKDAGRIQAVIDLVQHVHDEPRPSDALISAYFRGHRYIGSKDRTAIAEMTYDILRHNARLNWWKDYLKAGGDYARTIVLLYLALVQKENASGLARLFTGEQHAPAAFTHDETKLVAQFKGRTLLHPDMPQAVQYECPDWAYEQFVTRFGDQAKNELEAMLDAAPLDIRVNILKATREDVLKELKKLDIAAEATPLSPLGIRLKQRVALAQTDIFKNGLVEIQDEGSQMVAGLVDAKPGMSVVDFCAGAGGKTLAVAAAMNNKGRVVACDVLAKRLERARERFRRAGLHNIELHPLKNERDDWVKRNAGKYDRVLVDAPCSGTGTWRRNPDARWKKLGPGLEELLPLQKNILESASRLVKPGGRLIYATCSMLNEENAGQVDAFLEKNPEFVRIGDDLALTPAKNNTDGFYGAVLQRN